MTLLPAYDLRRQRDRLLDLLAIGETYPLQDTPLPTQTILVGFGELAHIPVYFSQLDVRYTLYFEENPVTRQDGGSVVVSGNGETVFLETEAIAEDVTYTIWATKIDSGRQSRLHQQVQIRVGLDTRLHAFIRDLPPLADSLLMPPPALARFGQTVAVELEASQEGIDYDLVVLQPGTAGEPELAQVISRQTVRGNRQNISLQIDDVTMDIDIRLRATRSGAGADAPDQLSAILDVVLPLRVRASQQLVVSALPAVVDHEAPAQLRLAGAQADVSYQLFARPLLDADYAYGQAAGAGVIQVPVPEAEPLPIYFPPAGPAWQLPADFVSLGPAQTGQESLDFDIPPLTRDTLVLVQARKAHALTLLPQEPDATVPSFVQLASPAVFLVRPQPRPALSLQALADGHTFQIQGGEPGTFLHFLDENEAPAAAPLYFYERDELVQRYFKGVARFRVAVNLVVDAGHEEDASGEATVAQPQLTLPALTTPIQLLLEAVYARSQARVRLAEPLFLAPAVTVAPEDPIVPFDGETRIRIVQSRANEYYQLWREETALGEPVKGTGRDRLLPTGRLTGTTSLRLHITQPDATWPVEQWLPINVQVLPEADIPLAIVSSGAPGQPLEIELARSTVGVIYQLMHGEEQFGPAVDGTGQPLRLRSNPLDAAPEALTVRAQLADAPELAVTFSQPIVVEWLA